jgi:hypothetical protein
MLRFAVWLLLFVAACGKADKPVDVHGVVLGGDGQPQEGALVSIAGRPAVKTAVDGTFAATRVPTPYQVIVGLRQDQLGRAAAVAWQGLRRTDPVLAFTTGCPQPWRSGTACGSVSGAVTTFSGWTPYVLLQSPGGSATLVQPDTKTYCASASWCGAPKTQAVAHVLQIDMQGSFPNAVARAFPTYGRSANVTLTDQQVSTNADVNLAPVSASALRVSTSLSPGQTAMLSASLFFGATGIQAEGIPLAWITSDSPWPDIAVPTISEMQVSARVLSRRDSGISIAQRSFARGGDWHANLPEPPIPVSPAEGATIPAESRFVWTSAGAFGVHVLEIKSYASPNNPLTLIRVITTGHETMVPDIAAVGVSLPAGGAGEWVVRDMGPVATIDDFTTRERLGMAFVNSSSNASADAAGAEMFMSESRPRYITVAARSRSSDSNSP